MLGTAATGSASQVFVLSSAATVTAGRNVTDCIGTLVFKKIKLRVNRYFAMAKGVEMVIHDLELNDKSL